MKRIAISVTDNNKGFINGFMRLFNPSGLFNHKYCMKDVFDETKTSESDFTAISSDWRYIGNDLENSIRKIGEQINEKK